MEMTPYKYHVVPGLFPYNMFLKRPLISLWEPAQEELGITEN